VSARLQDQSHALCRAHAAGRASYLHARALYFAGLTGAVRDGPPNSVSAASKHASKHAGKQADTHASTQPSHVSSRVETSRLPLMVF
jgi:hypothetical protein